MDAHLVPLTDARPYLTLKRQRLIDAAYLIAGFEPPPKELVVRAPRLVQLARDWLHERDLVHEDSDLVFLLMEDAQYVVLSELLTALRSQPTTVWGAKLIERSPLPRKQHFRVVPPPARQHVPHSSTRELTINDQREQVLRVWLRAENIPARDWHRLQSLGYSSKTIFDALHARDPKLFPALNQTFDRFWKAQKIARLRKR